MQCSPVESPATRNLSSAFIYVHLRFHFVNSVSERTTLLVAILIIIVLIVINGFFVAAEFAIAATPRTRAAQLAESGSASAQHVVGSCATRGR